MMPFYIIPEVTERLDSFEDYPSVKRWIWISPSSWQASHSVKLAVLFILLLHSQMWLFVLSFLNYLWSHFVASRDQIY